MRGEKVKVELEIQTKPEKDILERKVCTPKEVFDLDEVQAIKNAIQEHLLFIGMDKRNNVKSIRLIGLGTSDEINIDNKEIVRTALLTASERVILVHNHPSNNLTPSKQDLDMTYYTSKVLKAFNIEMLDHIIATEKDYYSIGKSNEIEFSSSKEKADFIENTFLKEENEKLKREREVERKMSMNKKYFEEYNDPEFLYQMLGRLESDCEYFLGNGDGAEKFLWALTVGNQISAMKEIYNKLKEKPDWMTLEKINTYEKEMKAKLKEKTLNSQKRNHKKSYER